jgi:hypothetical protein
VFLADWDWDWGFFEDWVIGSKILFTFGQKIFSFGHFYLNFRHFNKKNHKKSFSGLNFNVLSVNNIIFSMIMNFIY